MSTTDQDIIELSAETKEAVSMYAKYKADYLKLELAEVFTKVGTFLASSIIILFLAGMGIAFAGLGFSIYLGQVLENYALGALIVGSIYLIAGLLVFALRHVFFSQPLLSVIIDYLFTDEDKTTL